MASEVSPCRCLLITISCTIRHHLHSTGAAVGITCNTEWAKDSTMGAGWLCQVLPTLSVTPEYLQSWVDAGSRSQALGKQRENSQSNLISLFLYSKAFCNLCVIWILHNQYVRDLKTDSQISMLFGF